MKTYEFADINGARIHYQAVGAGRPLVLVHAGIAHLGMWDDQVGPLSQRYRVIRYDVRGWGKSVEPPGTFSDHEDLRQLLAYLHEERAAILGLSYGGRIAIDFTLAYPEMVAALIPVGPGLGGYEFVDETIKPLSAAAEEAYKSGDKALAAEFEARLWVDSPGRTPDQVDPAVRARALQIITDTLELPEGDGKRQELEPAALSRLEEIKAPVLAIVGDQDVADIQTIVDLLATRVPGARKVVMPGPAHFPNMEQPETFNRIVLDFLAAVPW